MDKSFAVGASNSLTPDNITATSSTSRPAQGRHSKPSRKRLPKRFDFIPEELRLQMFPRHGERVLAYRRQLKPKPSGRNARQPRKKTANSQAAVKPTTPISLPLPNSDVRPSDNLPPNHFDSSCKNIVDTYVFERSTTVDSSATSSGHASFSESPHWQCNGLAPAIEEQHGPNTSPISFAPRDYLQNHHSMTDQFTPQNDQPFQIFGFMPSVAYDGRLLDASHPLDRLFSGTGEYPVQDNYCPTVVEAEHTGNTATGLNCQRTECNIPFPDVPFGPTHAEVGHGFVSLDQGFENWLDQQPLGETFETYPDFNFPFATNSYANGSY